MQLENVLTLIIGNLAVILLLWLWTRSENRIDMRQLQEIQREDRKEIIKLVLSIDKEMKDFHNRLLEIEKSRK
jgi:hypothetical protein